MKSIRQLLSLGSCTLLFASSACFANTDQMNATLARINMILNQINPLINVAQQEQDPNARVKFQFDVLRSDINKIQSGIAQQINLVSIQPRKVTPIAGDYLPAQNKGG